MTLVVGTRLPQNTPVEPPSHLPPPPLPPYANSDLALSRVPPRFGETPVSLSGGVCLPWPATPKPLPPPLPYPLPPLLTERLQPLTPPLLPPPPLHLLRPLLVGVTQYQGVHTRPFNIAQGLIPESEALDSFSIAESVHIHIISFWAQGYLTGLS